MKNAMSERVRGTEIGGIILVDELHKAMQEERDES
jgi:hypothetical protein